MKNSNLYVKKNNLIFIKDIVFKDTDLPNSAIFEGINDKKNNKITLYIAERCSIDGNKLYYLREVPLPITVKTEYILDNIHKYIISANDGKSYEIDLLSGRDNNCTDILCFKKEDYAKFKKQFLGDNLESLENQTETTKVPPALQGKYDKIILQLIKCLEENDAESFEALRLEYKRIMKASTDKEKRKMSIVFDVSTKTLQDTFKKIKRKAGL